LSTDMVGKDSEMTLPNGNTISLPGNATSGSGNSKDLPGDPRNEKANNN
jgi:hypothetical protein